MSSTYLFSFACPHQAETICSLFRVIGEERAILQHFTHFLDSQLEQTYTDGVPMKDIESTTSRRVQGFNTSSHILRVGLIREDAVNLHSTGLQHLLLLKPLDPSPPFRLTHSP
jgi:hypothetical protein